MKNPRMEVIEFFKPTNRQREAVDNLYWLFDGARQSGRSYAMAIYYLDWAIHHLGEKRYAFDHFNIVHHIHNSYMIDLIQDLFVEYNKSVGEIFEFWRDKDSFYIILK